MEATRHLGSEKGVEVVAASRVYRNPAVGPADQPDYLNGVLQLKVTQAPRDLLSILLGIEARFGRVRSVRWGPRTLDLDILLYGDRVIQEAGLKIPHPHLHERPFVLVPLCDLDPHIIHPTFGKTIQALAGTTDRSGLVEVEGLTLLTER